MKLWSDYHVYASFFQFCLGKNGHRLSGSGSSSIYNLNLPAFSSTHQNQQGKKSLSQKLFVVSQFFLCTNVDTLSIHQ